MSKLEDYYRLFDMFNGKLTNEQKKVLEGLEDQLIAEEILPAISKSVAPVLTTLRRNLTLIVDYDTEQGVTVKTTRGEVVVKEHTAKKYQIPSTNKVVKVAEVDEEPEEQEPEEDNDNTPKFTRGPKVKFEVRLNGNIVGGKGAVDVFVNVIKQVGYQRVADLKIMFARGEFNLVERRKRSYKNKNWQREINGWYIYSNTSTPTKAENLAEIAERLNLDMEIILEGEKYYPREVQQQRTSSEMTIDSVRQYDRTKYILNGSKPLNKRRFAHALVKKYVEDHPEVDYEGLKRVFRPEIISGRGVVRSITDLDDIRPEEQPKRYLMKDDELIYLPQSDDIITVCSQWNPDRIAPMIDIARTLGYSVEEVEYETLDGDGLIQPMILPH